jgi:hypothetical protein
MSDKRAYLISECWQCKENPVCKILNNTGHKGIIPSSCPLPKWPSVTKNYVLQMISRLIPACVSGGGLEERFNDILAWLKSIGVEVRDGD